MARPYHKHVGITINVPEIAKATLDRQASARSLSPSVWAGQVFDIGFAAICARERSMPVTDADLDAIVGATLMMWSKDWDSSSIATGLGVPEPTIIRILDGWRDYRRAG